MYINEFTKPKPIKDSILNGWSTMFDELTIGGNLYDFDLIPFDKDELFSWLKSINNNDFWSLNREPEYKNDLKLFLKIEFPYFEEQMNVIADKVYALKGGKFKYKVDTLIRFNDAMHIALWAMVTYLSDINCIYAVCFGDKKNAVIHSNVCSRFLNDKEPFAYQWLRHCFCCYRTSEINERGLINKYSE